MRLPVIPIRALLLAALLSSWFHNATNTTRFVQISSQDPSTNHVADSSSNSIYQPVTKNYVQKRLPKSVDELSFYNECIISDRMKFIYVKTAKSAGSTTLLGWLRPSLCPPKNADDEFEGWGSKKGDANKFSKTCDANILFPPPGTDHNPCDTIPMWKWETYFVFATIRNPYARMRSSYIYCKTDAGLSWKEFCQDPRSANGCPFGSGRAADGHHIDMHYQFPTHWSYHGYWGWHLDYIIRVEDFDEGIAQVSKIVNDRARERGETILQLSPNSTLVNTNIDRNAERGQLCSFYRDENSVCALALEKTMDPEVLGYKDFCV